MCLLLAPTNPRVFLLQQITVLTRQTRQAIHAIVQSICLDAYGRIPAEAIKVLFVFLMPFFSTTLLMQILMCEK